MQATHPLLGKKLLVVTAHPDDESYVLAGTLAANVLAGGTNVLVCATHGERGISHLKRPTTKTALMKRRARELHAACSVLSVHSVYLCTIPDGKVGQHPKRIKLIIVQIAKRYAPDIVLSFGPCGITGHKDHVAVGKVAREVAKRLRVPFAAAVLSPKLQRAAQRFLASRRYAPHYHPTTKFVDPNLTIRIDARVKQRALRCHSSQMDGGKIFTGFPKYVVQGFLHREYFRVWQPR